MRRLAILLALIASVISVCAQRVSTQQFMVRKITFKVTDQIVPVSGISVKISNANFRSNQAGQFTANIPVGRDMGFYITSITAPGYVVSIPEDLKKKIYLSANPCVIVLADINAVKAERTRIYNNNKAALAKQEAKLNAEVKKNQELLAKINKQADDYAAVVAELEKTKRQLESFNEAKEQIEEKIDSLSDDLSLVDVMSLTPEEQQRVEKEKDGEWIDAIVDEVISKLESNMNKKHDDELTNYANMIKEISDDYYQKFIKGNGAFATRYFTGQYDGYLRDALSNRMEQMQQQEGVINRIVEKIIIEDLKEMVLDNVEECQKKWAVKDSDCDADYKAYSPASRTDEKIVSTLKKVYPQYYKQCEMAAVDYLKELRNMKNEELEKFKNKLEKNDGEIYVYIKYEVLRKARIKQGNNLNLPFSEFMDDIEEVIYYDCLYIIENEIVPKDKKEKVTIESLLKDAKKNIPHIDSAKCTPYRKFGGVMWEKREYFDNVKQRLDNIKEKCPEYVAHLYPIVMRFMQPIVNKYDTDKALYVYQSEMEEDLELYCLQPISNNVELFDIKNVYCDEGISKIAALIMMVETEKIIIAHNDRVKKNKESEEEACKKEIEAKQKAWRESHKDEIKAALEGLKKH